MSRILFLASFLLLVAGVYPDLLPEDKIEDLQGGANNPGTPPPPIVVVSGVIPEGNGETTTGNGETTTAPATSECITHAGKPGWCPNPDFWSQLRKKPPQHGHPHHGPPPKGKKFKKPKYDSSSEESVPSEQKPKFHSSSEESGPLKRRPKFPSTTDQGDPSKPKKNGGHHHQGSKRPWNPCQTPACGQDGDCPGDLKCCLISRCGMRCTRPFPTPPGEQDANGE